MKTLSHTIRFKETAKDKIKQAAEDSGRTFQAQVEYMLQEELKNQEVRLFLNRVQCSLENVGELDRHFLMAKIANLVDIELEQ